MPNPTQVDKKNAECAVFISSCDLFEDAWYPFFTLFFRYWPDCPFPVYLISNHKTYPDTRVTTIAVGKDNGWATNMQTAMKQQRPPYFIYMQEDYFLRRPVDSKRLSSLLFCLKNEDTACIRLYPSPGPNRSYKHLSGVGIIDRNAPYRISLQATLWNSKVFDSLVVAGENGWDMELKGTERSKHIRAPFLSIKRSLILNLNHNPALDYHCTGIVKGNWEYGTIAFLKKEGIAIDTNIRPVEPWHKFLKRRLRSLPVIGACFRFFFRVEGKLRRLINSTQN